MSESLEDEQKGTPTKVKVEVFRDVDGVPLFAVVPLSLPLEEVFEAVGIEIVGEPVPRHVTKETFKIVWEK